MAVKKKEATPSIEDNLRAALVPEAEHPYPIPENWVWTKLGVISSVITGKTPPTADPQYTENDDLPFITPAAFNMSDSIRSSDRYVSNAATRVAPLIPAKSTLLTSIGATLGKVAILEVPAVINQQINALIPRAIDAAFIFRWTCSQVFQEIMWSKSSATTLPIINKSRCEQLPVPIPPLPEQQRIAEKLESLLGKIKEAKALLDEIPEILQNFRQTVLAAACSGQLTEDWRKENQNIQSAEDLLKRKKHLIYKAHLKGLPSVSDLINDDLPSKWVFATLPYLVSTKKYSIKRGPFGSSLRKEYFVESGYKVYEQQHAIKNDFTLGNYYISRDKFNELKAFEVNEGDLIMSCSGTIGRIAVVPRTFEKGIINQALLKLTLDNEVILTDFSLFMFEDYLTKQEFASMTKGNAITNIASVTELKKIYFPLPPLSEQTEIVRRVESLFSKADDLEAQYRDAIELIETLPEIILSKAFRGSLVPQDPNDEPASVLLKKIREEQEQKKRTKHRKKFEG